MIIRSLIMLAALCAASISAVAAGDAAKAAADAWRTGHERQILTEFSNFVALPDVATNLADVDANAARLESMLRARGFATRLLRALPDTPATVFGELKVPGARRTVLYYAHYDGQPVGQKGWASPPFTPTMRSGRVGTAGVRDIDWRAAPGPANPDWRLYARAAADDKVTIEALLAAMDALKAAGLKPSVNSSSTMRGRRSRVRRTSPPLSRPTRRA